MSLNIAFSKKNETKNKDTIINLGLTYQKNANITNSLNEINIKKTSIFSLNEEKEKDNNHYVSISPKHRDPKNLKNFKKEKDFSKFSDERLSVFSLGSTNTGFKLFSLMAKILAI